jgi:hypothetical protein
MLTRVAVVVFVVIIVIFILAVALGTLDRRGHRQRPSDQNGLSRSILDSAHGQWYASQPIVTDGAQ